MFVKTGYIGTQAELIQHRVKETLCIYGVL